MGIRLQSLEDHLSTIAAHFAQNEFAEAVEVAHRGMAQWPNSLRLFQYLAEACLHAGYLDDAEHLFRHALSQGRSTFALVGMGIILTARGQRDAAAELLREALAADPANPIAWTTLAKVHRFQAGDPLMAQLDKQLGRRDLAPTARRDLSYVKCEALDQVGSWTHAWDQAELAARIETPVYDPGGLVQMVASARQVCTPDLCAPRDGRGDPTDAPIFVVGMPRSGTTLVSMILSMVPGVATMGELSTIPHMVRKAAEADAAHVQPPSWYGWLTRWPDDAVSDLSRHYLADVVRRNKGQMPTRFVDKMPANVLHLGVIACMFPNARIVRMVRGPLDTCVSCYLGRFGKGNIYTARVDWLADAYWQHTEVGDVLTSRIPNPTMTLRYEDLVQNPSDEIAQLLDFLDLPWTDACLTPGLSQAATTTRSITQVRAPINTASVGRWRRYGSRVAPLAAALGVQMDEQPAA